MKQCPQCGTPNEPEARFCSHCGAGMDEARPDPLVGRTVGGAYLLQDLIGVGGMGRVYRAEQSLLGRTVAIKVIHPHLLGDDQTVARFYNEARAASRLNHPDSVSIIDFGRTEDGVLYLVMEHLSGKDLAHVLAEEGPLPFPRIVGILKHVLSALGEAHVLGVVHRDLKPENIICRKARRGAEQVKVVDFGLAHIVGPGGTSITTPGLVCGTPDYMSPEQGKGETVDGRGDLYSVAVMLYEMLTDRLPYEDDTPTKVVFRHINDPIPDPRVVAPHRNIPDALAEICLKGLAKRAADRYQTADEMFEALARAEKLLETPRSSTIQICPSCQTKNPPDQRFCGTCGVRLSSAEITVPPALRATEPAGPRATSLVPGPMHSPLVGRQAELDRLLELRDRAHTRAVWVDLIGEPGIGKTRLLSELAERAAADGDAVALAGPHPSGAQVPYWPVRGLLTQLLGLDEARLKAIAGTDAVGDPIARAGILEALAPTGIEGRPGEARAEAVGAALAAAVRVAAGRARSGRVLLGVDDLYRCDSLTARTLTAAMEQLADGPLLLVTASPRRAMQLGDDVVKMLVRGLELDQAAYVLSGEPEPPAVAVDRDKETVPGGRLLLPLYLEQLRGLGMSGLEGDETLPPRLADVVVGRLERLDVQARRLLQVACVLGDRAPLDWVRALARDEELAALPSLQAGGLLVLEGGAVVVCHPFLRELVESSTPAEHRKQLHAAALQIAAGDGAPLEVRAEHAWRAGEPMSALLLLEQMGDSAIRRGDGPAAVLAFRRGLELARRELLMTGETSLDRAIVTFSRKLGDAMDRAGDTTAADGVLREALELAGPADRERTNMLLLLSRVAAGRNRQRDATRFLGQALELASRQKDKAGEARAHYALGRLRLADGDARTALGTLEKAIAHAPDRGHEPAFLVDAHLARADAMTAIGDGDGAHAARERARTAAQTAHAPALVARAVAAMAEAAAAEPPRAHALFREAAQLAAEAGDARSAQEYLRRGGAATPRRATG
ncbi:MAG: protein kinase [Sandaracinaceae bacterium]|nr:protein kinase [Sandaracinaceae bacterium]